MIAHHFAKPLQGSLLKKLRNMILGINEEGSEIYNEKYKQSLVTFSLVDS